MTGLEQMQAISDGSAPPAAIQDTLDFALSEVGEGRVVFTATPGAKHLNPMGGVHGGLALTLIDSACGAAVHTTLPEGGAYGTLETSGNLVRPIAPGGEDIVAEGRVVHRGGRVATAEARIVGADSGKLYAHGTSTCLVL